MLISNIGYTQTYCSFGKRKCNRENNQSLSNTGKISRRKQLGNFLDKADEAVGDLVEKGVRIIEKGVDTIRPSEDTLDKTLGRGLRSIENGIDRITPSEEKLDNTLGKVLTAIETVQDYFSAKGEKILDKTIGKII